MSSGGGGGGGRGKVAPADASELEPLGRGSSPEALEPRIVGDNDDDGGHKFKLRSHLKSLRWSDPYDFALDGKDAAAAEFAAFDFDRKVPGRKCLTGTADLAVKSLCDLVKRCPCCLPFVLPLLLLETWRTRTERRRDRKLADCRHLAATPEGILYVEDERTLRGTPREPKRVFVPFRSVAGVAHLEGEGGGRVAIHYVREEEEEEKGRDARKRPEDDSPRSSPECLWIERLERPDALVELVRAALGDDRTIRHGEGYVLVCRRSRTAAAAAAATDNELDEVA